MRASGILMHITSLPGPCGVGTMGREAYKFADFLQQAGQRYWQVLPLTPTGYGDSPYQSCSAYAGNPYLIDLELLCEQGMLTKQELEAYDWGSDPGQVDFGLQYQNRFKALRQAFSRFREEDAYRIFCRENSAWLSDYALFMALKNRFGGKPWYEWDESLKRRDPDAVWKARGELREDVKFYSFIQYLFFSQWKALRAHCRAANIQIIGDVPIYVPYDSADVWQDPEWFALDENLTPIAVAGCPPDGFSEDGQLWGNPLYRWDALQKDGYGWWLRRLKAAANLYDVIRIDHFRGFAGYFSIPYGAPNARGGKWLPGPGLAFMQAVRKALPDTAFIAEDLGYLTDDVHALREHSGCPGMKVLEFAFDGGTDNVYLPHNHTQNSVCYIGTHDNMPLAQWLAESGEKTLSYLREYIGEDLHWGMIRSCMASVSDLAVVQMQDYLELGAEARMNFPGTMGGNWTWRAKPGFTNDTLAEKIKRLTRIFGRL